uniref:Vesicle transport protein n=1 Tax=Populus trichocarpa TaxID=3694 RepID=A0A3N7HAB2_POPTR
MMRREKRVSWKKNQMAFVHFLLRRFVLMRREKRVSWKKNQMAFVHFLLRRECMHLLLLWSLVWLLCFCTAFLIGPGRQLGMMFDPVRIYATAIYIGCVVLALICALLIHSKILTVFAIIFEICALIWYSLSSIPFARRMVSNLMIRLCDTEL